MYPSPTTRPSRTMTQLTMGLGLVRPVALRASSTHVAPVDVAPARWPRRAREAARTGRGARWGRASSKEAMASDPEDLPMISVLPWAKPSLARPIPAHKTNTGEERGKRGSRSNLPCTSPRLFRRQHQVESSSGFVSQQQNPNKMLFSSGGRRLVALIRRTAGGTKPHPHAARSSHRSFSTSTSAGAGAAIAPDPESSHTTTSYLIASCGLSPTAAAAVASRGGGVRIISTAKANSVLALLRRYGFSDSQIALLIRQAPKLLVVDPDKILRPKLEFFASLGFPVGWLANKQILDRSLNSYIIPCVDLLRCILGTDANIRLAASRHKFGFSFNPEKRMRPALQALRHHGLSEEVISKLVLLQIGVLGLAPDRIAGIIEDLKGLGLLTSDSRFVYGFRVLCSINKDTWLRKAALYQSLGVSEDELSRAFRKQPTIMLISTESIKKKTRFFLDELKLDLSHVMRRPVLLGYSLDKCILPRCAVLSVLMREGKIERDVDLLHALLGGSNRFLKRYVLRYAGSVPDVVEAYDGKITFEGFKDQTA
jgi:mTERF domain-containing protein, mitochondrial